MTSIPFHLNHAMNKSTKVKNHRTILIHFETVKTKIQDNLVE